MADRYLIGTGNRNWNDPTIWSLTSGGSPYQPASGTEKITNVADREFSSDTGFWTKTAQVTISGGFVNLKSTDASYQTLSCNLNLTVGKSYKIQYTVLANRGGVIGISFGASATQVDSTVGSKTVYFIVNGGALVFVRQGVTDIDIDNISVQEVDTIAPDATTNCIFDNNSGTGTLTVNAIANMLDFTCSNIGALTLANAAYAFNVFGSLTLHTNLTVTFTSTGYLYMKAVDSRTITTNGKVANWNRLYFDGVGGTWVNQDNYNGSADTYLTNGTWDLNSKTITTGIFDLQSGTKSIRFGTAILTCNSWIPSVANYANFTVTPDNGTVISLSNFAGGSKTYYNVEIKSQNTRTIYGINIFNNLTISVLANDIRIGAILDSNQTVNSNLTINGNNASNYRLLIASNTIGTSRTITCNGTVTASNVDFRDITLAGTCNKDLSDITGGSGDCGGNSGITFTTGQPQYFKKYAATANYGDAANWFSDLALTVAGRVPLPQDLGSKFLATSFDRTCTVSCNVPRIPCLDMSEVVNSVTWSLANALEVYGSYVLGANITPSGNSTLTLMGRGNFILNTYAKTITGSLYIQSIGGFYTNFSHINLGIRQLRLYYGTFDANDYNINASTIYGGSHLLGATATDTFVAGNGIITLTSNNDNCWGSSKNFICESSTIIINPIDGSSNLVTFIGGSKIYNKVVFSGSHTGYSNMQDSNTIAELIIDSGRKVRFTAGTTQTIAKATIGVGATISSITAATHTLNYTGSEEVVADGGITVTNSIATPSEKWFTGAGSTDGGGNSGWIFGTIDDAFTPKIMWFD